MEICRGCGLYNESGSGCVLPGSQPCCNKDKSELVDGKEIQGCGCSLALKGRSLSSFCPLGKWTAILTLQEEEMLKRQLDDKG